MSFVVVASMMIALALTGQLFFKPKPSAVEQLKEEIDEEALEDLVTEPEPDKAEFIRCNGHIYLYIKGAGIVHEAECEMNDRKQLNRINL
jgi:hypothetical protein